MAVARAPAAVVVPAEDAVQALIDHLVAPLLPARPSATEIPDDEQQEVIAKQMHAVVLLYNYYHRREYPELEFLGFESFCKVAVINKPSLLMYLKYMRGCEEDKGDLNNQLSITERMVRNACNICTSLDASKNVPDMESWPTTKVTFFLVDSLKEKCLLQFFTITQGIWSLAEKDLDTTYDNLVCESQLKTTSNKKRTASGSAGKQNSEIEDVLNQLALSTVEEKTGIENSKLSVLEHHTAYSLSQERTTARLYIMMYTGSVNDEFVEVPIKDVLSMLKGALFKMNINPEVTQVVDYCHLLPYADILSHWLERETLHGRPLHVGRLQTVANAKNSSRISRKSPINGLVIEKKIGRSQQTANTVRKRRKLDETLNEQIDCVTLLQTGSMEPNMQPRIGFQPNNGESMQREQTTGILTSEKIMGDTDEKNEDIDGIFTTGSNGAVCKRKADISTKKLIAALSKKRVGHKADKNEGISELLNDGPTEVGGKKVSSLKRSAEAIYKKKAADNSFSVGIQNNEKIMGKTAEKNEGIIEPLNSGSTDTVCKKRADGSVKRSTNAVCKKKDDNSFSTGILRNQIMGNTTEKNGGIREPLNSVSTEAVCKKKADGSFRRSTEAVCKKNGDSSFSRGIMMNEKINGNTAEENDGISEPFNSGLTEVISKKKADNSRRRSTEAVCKNNADSSFRRAQTMIMGSTVEKNGITEPLNRGPISKKKPDSSFPTTNHKQHPVGVNIMGNSNNLTRKNQKRSVPPSRSEDKNNEKDTTPNFDVSSAPPSRSENKVAALDLTKKQPRMKSIDREPLSKSVTSDAVQDRMSSGEFQFASKSHDSDISTSPKKDDIVQASLGILRKKLTELRQHQRQVEEQVAVYEMNIETILSGGEDTLALNSELIMEACDGFHSSQTQARRSMSSEEPRDSENKNRKRLSEAVLSLQSPCQKLDDICYENGWISPRYNVIPSSGNGMYQANVAIQGEDFECADTGELKSGPGEARESAASHMLKKLRSMACQ